MAWRFHISPVSGVPIYRQVMDQVRGAVAAGRLRPGDALPSVRETAQELAVNPMTISKAYSLLEKEGVLEVERGKPMRVAAPRALGTLRQRRQAIEPLLRQVAATAFYHGLAPQDVLSMLEAILKESDDGRGD